MVKDKEFEKYLQEISDPKNNSEVDNMSNNELMNRGKRKLGGSI